MLSATALIAGLALFVAACGRKPTVTDQVRHYETRGIVRGFSPDRQLVDIQHEDIPGFMPSMTMPFSVHDPEELNGRMVGDTISFRISVTGKDLFVDQIRPLASTDLSLPNPSSEQNLFSRDTKRLKEGDAIPSFSIVDQDDQPVSLETFRGRPFVLTFIFTRCPVPKFCPLMTNNFAELQQAIQTGTGAVAATRLLSVTLDPVYDTPQILKEYGASQKANPAVWKFATGKPEEIDALIAAFSVYRQTEGGTISHGLATILADSDGTIKKIWRGNAWTPAEVIAEIQSIKEHE